VVGFGTGWIYYISRITAFAANSTLLAAYVGALWAPAGSPAGRAVVITLACGLLTWANYVGVRDGVRTLSVLTVLRLTPILLLILLGLPYVCADTLVSVGAPEIEDPGGTILMMMFAFVGFESTTIVSGESVEPRRTLPSALVRTTLFIAAFYFLVVLAYVAVLPHLDGEPATLVGVGEFLMGPTGAVLITLAAVFSIGGNLGAILLAVPRLTYALSQQHQLPRWFGAVHARYATPGNSILFLGALSLALALSGTFDKLIIASSLTRLITYILCISALPLIHRRATAAQRRDAWRLPGGDTIPALALMICLWIAAQSGPDEWLLTAGLFAIGVALYVLARLTRGGRGDLRGDPPDP
jgi:amino acid transporter